MAGRPTPRRDERGAVAIIVGICVVLLTGVASFAIDLGYQRVAALDMQAVADLVAMDMARELDGRTSQQLINSGNWVDRVQRSLDHNKLDHTAGAAIAAVSCDLDDVSLEDSQLGEDDGVGVCAYPGLLQADGTFGASGAGPATHVKVLDRTTVDYFLPVFAAGGAVSRAAVAKATSTACLKLGSFAVNLDSSKSALLNVLLGDALNTTVLGYSGLATARVSLLDLATELGVGSPQQVFGSEVTVSDFYLAMADVLVNNGDTGNASLLQSIAAQANVAAPIQLSDLISVDTMQGAVLAGEFNVLDLVAGSAFVANGTNLLSIPATTVNVPNLSNVTISLKVVEAPMAACGRVGQATARTSQFELTLTGKVLNANLASLGSLLGATAELDINLSLSAAKSEATLSGAVCGGGTVASPMSITADVQNALQKLALVAPTRIKAKVLGIPVEVLRFKTSLTDTSSAGTEAATVTIDSEPSDPGDWDVPTSTGSNSLGLTGATLTTSELEVLGTLNLSTVLPALQTDVLTPLAVGLDSQLIKPLTELLGLTLGGSDLYAVRPGPTCNTPALAG